MSGHGLTAGFHRLFTHRSFKASRWVKITLAVAGSLGMEGSVISWVANHRRHHAYTDTKGDPHSPYQYGDGTRSQIRGAVHAHVGWLFQAQQTQEERWAPDLVKDRDLVAISRLFPLLGIVSLGLPMLIGWAITQTWEGALGGLIWGGFVRVFVLHHATFSVNSACHLWDAGLSSHESMIWRPTSPPWRFWPWGRTGTTSTTRVRLSPVMVWIATNSTPRHGSFEFFSLLASHGT